MAWMDHDVPFNASASVATTPELFSESPAAVQAMAEMQATLLNVLAVAPEGMAVVSIDQMLPFPASAGAW